MADRFDKFDKKDSGIMRPLALLLILAVCSNQHLYGEEAAAQCPGEPMLASSSSSLTFAGSQLPGLSLQEYKKLRTEALGRARIISGPVIRNPQAVNKGIDPAPLAALEMQRSYLEAWRRELRSQGSLGDLSRQLSRTATEPAYAGKQGAKAKIVAVNGRSAPAFTPQPPDNHYRIQGCCFGRQQGKVQLKLGSGAGGHSRLLVLKVESPASWSNEEIGAQIDPGVSRLPDYTGEATLQVITAGNEVLELPGCSFVAARNEPRLLTLIPSSWATFNTREKLQQSPEELEYLSPPRRPLAGAPPTSSAFVFHSDVSRLPPGEDFFDFSHLQNGWIIESAQLESYALSCPGAIIASAFGPMPDLKWSSRGLRVRYESAACVSRLVSGHRFSMSAAAYALKVWIVGPAQTEFMQARLP